MAYKHSKPGSQRGFTLVEIAIVLLVVAILLGYSVALLPVQQELKQYNHANDEMNRIVEQLIAFAQVNGRLPCPDDGPDGLEDQSGGNDCNVFYGYLPARTLGIDGKYSDAGALIDPWGTEYRYAVSEGDVTGDGDIDMVTPNGIRDEGIANVVDPGGPSPPDLYLCTDNTVISNDADCGDVTGGAEAVGEVAAVIVSLGKDFNPAASNIQAENDDSFLASPTSDRVFILAPRRDDYDDIVKWVSTNLLISRMIQADRLP